MARLPRLAFAGQAHLLAQRGHSARPVFTDDDDRRAFVAALAESSRLEDVAIHGYALHDQQILLLATPRTEAGLGRLMQALGRRYGRDFNRRHGFGGGLWAGRFAAGALEPGHWLLRGLCFIEASVSGSWSSAAHHLGRRHEPWIREHADYWSLGNTPFEREAAWEKVLAHGLDVGDADRLQSAIRRGWPVGSEHFISGLASQTKRTLTPKPPGRPRRLSVPG